MRNERSGWTVEQLMFIYQLKQKGFTSPEIRTVYNREHPVERSNGAIASALWLIERALEGKLTVSGGKPIAEPYLKTVELIQKSNTRPTNAPEQALQTALNQFEESIFNYITTRVKLEKEKLERNYKNELNTLKRENQQMKAALEKGKISNWISNLSKHFQEA